MLRALLDASKQAGNGGSSGALQEADGYSHEGARVQFAKELVDELDEISAEAHVAITGEVLPAELRPGALVAAEGSAHDHGGGGSGGNDNSNGDASEDHDNEGIGNGAPGSEAMALEAHRQSIMELESSLCEIERIFREARAEAEATGRAQEEELRLAFEIRAKETRDPNLRAYEKAEHVREVEEARGAVQERTEKAAETRDGESERLIDAWRASLSEEGPWLLRWRANARRRREDKKRSNSKASLKLQLSITRESEAEARTQLAEAVAEGAALRKALSAERLRVKSSEAGAQATARPPKFPHLLPFPLTMSHLRCEIAALHERDEALRLLRGFASLRLHQTAKNTTAAAELSVAAELEAQVCVQRPCKSVHLSAPPSLTGGG